MPMLGETWRMGEQPKGIMLRRTKGWRLPPGAITVARPSRWGNIFAVGSGVVSWSGQTSGPSVGEYSATDTRYGDLALGRGLTAAEAVELYRQDLMGSLADPDPYLDELRAALTALRGHDLACWCPLDQPCHRNVLLELANG